jgi:hypothetical protein
MQVGEETVLFSKPAMIETRHRMLTVSTPGLDAVEGRAPFPAPA